MKVGNGNIKIKKKSLSLMNSVYVEEKHSLIITQHRCARDVSETEKMPEACLEGSFLFTESVKQIRAAGVKSGGE